MKLLKTKIAVSVICSLVLLSGSVLAQISPNVQTPSPVTVSSPQGLIDIINRVIGWIYTFFFVIAIILILFAAFTYLTSSGDPEKVTKAKNQLIYAAVAVAVALLAYSFTAIVRGVVGT